MANKDQEYYLIEKLKTIKNLCDISILLIQWKHLDLLATPLEYIYEEAQEILDETCVVED